MTLLRPGWPISTKVLPGHLQRCLDRFGAAGHEVGLGEAAGFVPHQILRQGFRRFGGEEAGMGVGERVGLAADRLDDTRVLVAQAAHGGAAGRVQQRPAVRGLQPDALAAHGHGWRGAPQASVQDAAGTVCGHGVQGHLAVSSGPAAYRE